MKNTTCHIIIFFLLFGHTVSGLTTEKKDPYLRDDDISFTTVNVEVTQSAEGLFHYVYDIRSPMQNTGAIRTFQLDISCSDIPDSRDFEIGKYSTSTQSSSSLDGKHIPVAINVPRGQAMVWGIAENNAVQWLLASKPGMDSLGLKLITPYPPGTREYRLVPSMRYREEEYDYSGLDHDAEVPWTEDFTITGLTTGPACPGEEYPDHEEPSPRFLGSPFPGQPELNNALLSYSAPLRDQFHVEPGVRELEMTIHYHENIDPKTFVVTPEKNQLRRLFNPQPGSQETVRLPLQPGKNRIELQVQSRFTPPGRATTPPRETRGREEVSLDRDVFVIRVPDDATAPGKGRGRQ